MYTQSPKFNNYEDKILYGMPPSMHGSTFDSVSGSYYVATTKNCLIFVASLIQVLELAIDIPQVEMQFQVFEHHFLKT